MMTTEPDLAMQRIGDGIVAHQQGDDDLARSIYQEVWEAIGAEGGDALCRCALAHSMADVQVDPQAELVWDLRALDAADLLTDERVRSAGVPGTARGFYPSLHLNLADIYRRLGDDVHARQHVQRGKANLGFLVDDGYGAMIRDGLERIERQLPGEATP